MAVTSPILVSGVGGCPCPAARRLTLLLVKTVFCPSDPPPSTGSLDPPEHEPTAAFFIRYYLSDSDHLRARQPACRDGRGLVTVRSNPCGSLLSARRTSPLSSRVTVGAKG